MALGRRAAAAVLACAAAGAGAGATAASARADELRVSATPRLVPAFDPSVTDYVSECGRGEPLRLSVELPKGAEGRVDSRPWRTESFAPSVELGQGQAVRLAVRSDGRRRAYHVRCLPVGFPQWSFRRFKPRPGAQWYLFAPVKEPDTYTDASRYVVLMSRHGVPVWWRREDFMPFNSTLLPNEQVAYSFWDDRPFGQTGRELWEIHRLDGSHVRTLRTIGSPTDVHDMQPLPNGNFMLMTYRLRRNVDVSKHGGSGTVNVLDGELQELTPDGRLRWSWSSGDHVKLSETEDHWSNTEQSVGGEVAYDIFHLNSVEPDGDGYVISARHVNAVYRIDRKTKRVDWKLGGTRTPESLAIEGDPKSPSLLRQHDARVLDDGTITVYDNRSGGGQPRAARFRVRPGRGTARLLESVTDRVELRSNAQGSARRLPNGNWVVSWGSTGVISEVTGAGRPVFRLRFAGDNYRIEPVRSGRLSAGRLRKAMNRMYPRGAAR